MLAVATEPVRQSLRTRPNKRRSDAISESTTSVSQPSSSSVVSKKPSVTSASTVSEFSSSMSSAVSTSSLFSSSAASSSSSTSSSSPPLALSRSKRGVSLKKELELLQYQLAGLVPFARPTSEAFSLSVVEVAGKGRGVVCNAPIPSGRYVAEYRGQLLTGADALAREQHYAALPPDQDPGCYLFFFRHNDKLHCIDATSDRGQDGLVRLMNHSRLQPNLSARKVVDSEGAVHIALFALRDIAQGEELTFDYGETDPAVLAAFPWLANS